MKLARLTPVTTGLSIRPLTIAELPLCEVFGRAFMCEKHVAGAFSLETFIQNWTIFLMQYPSVILGLWRDGQLIGGIGGMVAPDINTGERIATEFFWYVDPAARQGTWPIRLLTHFRQWATTQGAVRLRMIHLLEPDESPSTVKLARVYAKLGLHPIEVSYEAPLEKGR